MQVNEIYGVYRCEYCHAEFRTLDEKWKHIKKFHKDTARKTCNMYNNFRQSVLWEYEELKQV